MDKLLSLTDANAVAPDTSAVFTRLSTFASESGPHISLKAEELFEIWGISITNSILYGLLISAVMAGLGVWAAKKVKLKPQRGIALLFELALIFIRDLLAGIFNSDAKARQYAPIFTTFFIFIVLSNLSGLLPWVGEGITIGATPVFRPFTADLNATLAMSVIGIVTVQYLSIKESGIRGHMKHYFTDKPYNPINFFIGVLEVFSEFTRILSLALRLFLNTAVGEILVAVFLFVGASFGSLTLLPIALFETLVALIQAYVFTVLCATYLALAIHHDEGEHTFDESPTHSDPERLIAQELA